MRDCKLRCILGSMEFTKGNIYTIKNDTLVGDETEFEIPIWYGTIEQINDDFEAQFEIFNPTKSTLPFQYGLFLSEVKAKYGSDCHDEIVDVIKKYKDPLDKVYIDVFKSIVGLVDGATYYQDGTVYNTYNYPMFTIKQNLPLGDKQYILQEEIDKYESANR